MRALNMPWNYGGIYYANYDFSYIMGYIGHTLAFGRRDHPGVVRLPWLWFERRQLTWQLIKSSIRGRWTERGPDLRRADVSHTFGFR
jgi:hypothetical protein